MRYAGIGLFVVAAPFLLAPATREEEEHGPLSEGRLFQRQREINDRIRGPAVQLAEVADGRLDIHENFA